MYSLSQTLFGLLASLWSHFGSDVQSGLHCNIRYAEESWTNRQTRCCYSIWRGLLCSRAISRWFSKERQLLRPKPLQAKKDLEDMRACGALFGEDRTKGLEAMKAEARRIQECAAHEREIRHAMLLRGQSGFDSDSDDIDDPAINDPDEWWQDLQEGKITKPVIPPKEPITNPAEATKALIKFRPLHEDAGD